MSGQDLEQRGAFLPEELRGEVELEPTIRPLWLALLGAAGVACCVVMALSDGGAATWIAAALFAILLQVLALVAGHGIRRQNTRLERLEREARRDGRG